MPLRALVPIFAFFAIGILLRRSRLATREHAALLFRLVLNVTLPALVLLSISEVELTRTTMLLPISGFLVNGVCVLAALIYVRMRGLDWRRAGAVVLGAGVTNLLFAFPFILATLGQVGLAIAVLYDVGNAVFFATVAYALAMRFGASERPRVAATLFKTLRAPIFLAIAAALAVNLAGLTLPGMVRDVLTPLAGCTTPLVLIAVGLYFSTTGLLHVQPLATLLLRMPLGLAAGALAALLFGFQGLTAVVVAVAAAAPIGFNSVTLVSMADLDAEQATSALSLSIAVGMVSTTALLYVFGIRVGV